MIDGMTQFNPGDRWALSQVIEALKPHLKPELNKGSEI